MRSTRRLPDWQSPAGRRAPAALLLVAAAMASGAIASCSSGDEPNASTNTEHDGGADAPFDASSALDGGGRDADGASSPPFDGGPLPIVCASTPCATSLVTTIGSSAADAAEGYCVRLDDGTVACWGANGAGQLGRGEDAGVLDDPSAARVAGLSNIVAIDHGCALDTNGDAWCWGTGPHLRGGSGARTTDRAPVKLPIPPARHVAMGIEVGCAAVDGDLLCWGKNTNAQLAPLGVSPASALLPPQSILLPSGAPVRELLVTTATFVVREDGSALSWGANPPIARVSSRSPDPGPLAIALDGLSSIDLTTGSACATTRGTGYCWGTVIGAATPVDRALPEPVVAPEPLVRISTTTARSSSELGVTVVRPQRWCGVTAAGAVYCWGLNASAQAGDGTKQHAYEAVRVDGLPGPVSQVKTMPDSTCALLTTGKVYCWGANYYGQLGNRKPRVPSLVPEEVVLP